MKVKCIDNNMLWGHLTMGRIYEVKSIMSDSYGIDNDRKDNGLYDKTRFETIVEEGEEFEVGEMVYRSDISIEKALKDKIEIEYRGKIDDKFICKNEYGAYAIRNHIAKIPKEKTKRELPEMTDEEYNKVLEIYKLIK